MALLSNPVNSAGDYQSATERCRPSRVRGADSGLLSAEWAAGIRRVKGVRKLGVRRKVNERVTELTISHYDSTSSLKARLFNLIGKRKIARETYATLHWTKAQIE
jgi:hypothetical protein